MAFNYAVQVNGSAADFGDPIFDNSSTGILAYDLEQALGVFSQELAGQGTLVVDLDIATTAARADGGPTASGSSTATSAAGTSLYSGSAFDELATGQHVTGTTSDITVTVSPDFLQYLDLAPGLSPSSVNANLLNPIDVFQHEIMHGLGMFGWRDASGALPSGYESVFDYYSALSASGADYFYGPIADLVYGGPVPLTSTSTTGEDYYHFGDTQSDFNRSPATVTDPLTLDLMNGIASFTNYQYTVSSLDLAVLKDMGYTLTVNQLTTMAGGHLYLVSSTNDAIVGGTGLNTAIFDGSISQYTISNGGGVVSVVDSVAGRDGAATLTNVQQLRFFDLTLVLDLHSSQDFLVYELYQAAFARTPDNAGFRYWATSADAANPSPVALADAFLGAAEFTQNYGANPSNTTFVTELYSNILGRAPDASGLAYWIGEADAGLAHDQLLIAFATSPENVQLIGPHTANGYWTT